MEIEREFLSCLKDTAPPKSDILCDIKLSIKSKTLYNLVEKIYQNL